MSANSPAVAERILLALDGAGLLQDMSARALIEARNEVALLIEGRAQDAPAPKTTIIKVLRALESGDRVRCVAEDRAHLFGAVGTVSRVGIVDAIVDLDSGIGAAFQRHEIEYIGPSQALQPAGVPPAPVPPSSNSPAAAPAPSAAHDGAPGQGVCTRPGCGRKLRGGSHARGTCAMCAMCVKGCKPGHVPAESGRAKALPPCACGKPARHVGRCAGHGGRVPVAAPKSEAARPAAPRDAVRRGALPLDRVSSLLDPQEPRRAARSSSEGEE